MIKEGDVVLHNDMFARVVFLWRTTAVIMVGKRIFEAKKKDLRTIDPDVISMTFDMLLNDMRFVA